MQEPSQCVWSQQDLDVAQHVLGCCVLQPRICLGLGVLRCSQLKLHGEGGPAFLSQTGNHFVDKVNFTN